MKKIKIMFKDGEVRYYEAQEIRFNGDRHLLELIDKGETIIIEFDNIRALKEVNIREIKEAKG